MYINTIIDNFETAFPRYSLEFNRGFQAYGVGMLKSGTHSIAGIFSKFQARHEPFYQDLLDIFVARQSNNVTGTQITKYLKERDLFLNLEMDSSCFNVHFIDIFVKEFPESKYILTIRDCHSWLDSVCNSQINYRLGGRHKAYHDIIFGLETFKHSKHAKILEEYGLYSLEGYLSYWRWHNEKIISSAPKDRLLILKTREIRNNFSVIADFLGIDPNQLDDSKSQVFVAPRKNHILDKIDGSYLNDAINYFSLRK